MGFPASRGQSQKVRQTIGGQHIEVENRQQSGLGAALDVSPFVSTPLRPNEGRQDVGPMVDSSNVPPASFPPAMGRGVDEGPGTVRIAAQLRESPRPRRIQSRSCMALSSTLGMHPSESCA